MSDLYVHALTGGPFPPFEHAGRRIGFENLQGVFAAIEARSAPPALSEAELRVQHAIIVEIAGRADAVLPARFGSFVPRAELHRLVDLRRDSIREALDLVKGREQMTIRVLGDASQAEAALAAAKSPATHRPGTAYLLDRQAAVRSKLPPDVEAALNDAVRHLVVAVRAERGEGTTLARIYHLIQRGSEPAYRQALAPAVDALSGTTIVTTGPWPTFAFTPELWP